LEWLNSLPQTQEILKSLFNGAPINKQNLSDWKKGGFRDWQAQQEALGAMQQMASEAEELQSSSTELLSDKVATWLLARYFMKLKQALAAGGADELKLLREFSADVVALRRGDHTAARLKLAEEQLELAEGESEEEIMEYFYDWVREPEVNDWIRDNTMPSEEQRRLLQAILRSTRTKMKMKKSPVREKIQPMRKLQKKTKFHFLRKAEANSIDFPLPLPERFSCNNPGARASARFSVSFYPRPVQFCSHLLVCPLKR
jgi:hypothetical protein